MNRRALRCLVLLCLSLCSLVVFSATAQQTGNVRAWLEKDRIQLGEELTLSWQILPASGPRDLWLYGDIYDANAQTIPISIELSDIARQGSYSFRPTAAGTLILSGQIAGDGPLGFKAIIDGKSDDAPLTMELTVDGPYVSTGDNISASMQVSGGRKPYAATELAFMVRTEAGDLEDVAVSMGMANIFTVPAGIQGIVEARVEDALGRSILRRQYLAINGAPDGLFYGELKLGAPEGWQGMPLTATWTLSGGDPPYQVSREWSLVSDSTGLQGSGLRQDGDDWSAFTPAEQGYGTVIITARDSRYREVELRESFRVLEGPPATPEPTSEPTAAPTAVPTPAPPTAPPVTEAPTAPPVTRLYAASLNQRMATRSGPGTQYSEELGTLKDDTPIQLVHQVTTNGTPWGLAEFDVGGRRYRAYTGMKRISMWEYAPEISESYYEHRLTQSRQAYYGPGYDYAEHKRPVPAGANVRVFWEESGFYVCDWQEDGRWVRGYLPGL